MQVVTHQDDGFACGKKFLNFIDASPLEVLIANGQDLIDEKNVGVAHTRKYTNISELAAERQRGPPPVRR